MKKRLIAFLLVLIMVLGMLPVSALAADDGISPQALNTGHKIDVRFTVLYVGDEFNIGYNYGTSEKTQFVCQYTQPHSDTAYNNHTIAISDIKAAADRASVNSGYQIVGWSKESNANPTVWPLNKTGTTACNKGTTIYLVAKDPNPQVTYTLNYHANGGDENSVPASQTEKSNTGKVTFTVSSKEPTRDGYKFLGWNGNPNDTTVTVKGGNTITTTAKVTNLYAVWESKTPPTDKPVKPGEGDFEKAGLVSVECSTKPADHAKETYDLKKDTFTIGEVEGNATDGYTCEITVTADSYVSSYVATHGAHTLTGDNTKKFTLTWVSGKWVAKEGGVTFPVQCEQTPPPEIPGDQKPNIEEANAKIRVQCIEYPSKHNPYKQNYRILPGSYDDLGWDRTEYGYIYSIRLNRAKYIAQFDQEIGRPHTDTEPNEETRINWRWENGAWHLIDGPDGVTADIKVKCAETPVEPEKPTALDGSFAIVCKNNEATHAHKADYIATPSQYTISDVQTDEQGYYVTATVTVAPNLAAYNNLTGAEHRLVNEQDATLTITFRYDTEVTVDGNRKWKQQGEVPVVEVICKPKAPTADELKELDMAVLVKCVVDNSQQHTEAYGLLGEYDEDYFVGEPRKDGDDWLCDISYVPDLYVAAFNTTFQNLKHVQNDEKIVPVTLIWAGDSWQIKEQGRVPVTEVYTVTYTDGVENEEVFADQVYSDLRKDSTTPAFNGTPTRTGYTFAGWEPEVAETVTETVTYAAKWTPVEPKAPTADELKELDMAVLVKCVVDNSQQHTEAYGLLGEYDEDYFVGEPRKDGDDWLCDISYVPDLYVAAFNTTFQNLKHVQNDEKIVPVTLIWAGDSWQIKEQGRVPVTEVYTVTYTDGVENEEVFADQVYSDLRKDSTTPAFNGTPTRTGYTFAGWDPEVAETVTANATYTAKWTPVEPTREDIFKALNGLVTVTCINRFWKDGNKNMDCGQGQYAAKAGIAGQDYTLVKGENAGTWVVTFPVTNFVKSFKQDPAHNLYTKDTLSWYIRWEDNAWTSEPVESGVDDLVKLTHAPTDWREVAKIATGGKSDCIHTSCVNGETGVCDYGITVPFVYFNTDVVSVEPEDGVPGSYIATFKVDRYIDTCAKACNDKNFPDAPRTHKLLTQETVQWRLYATSEADEKIGNNVLNHVWEAEPVEAGKDDVCTIAHNWVVTFNPANGEPAFTQDVEYEGNATEPAAPEKTGYTFDGWFAPEAEEPFNFDTTITADITLTAKWEAKKANVHLMIFKSSDLTKAIVDVPYAGDKLAGETIDLTEIDPSSYLDFDFEIDGGWYDDGMFNSYKRYLDGLQDKPAGLEKLLITGNWQNLKLIVTELVPVVYFDSLESLTAYQNDHSKTEGILHTTKARLGSALPTADAPTATRDGYTFTFWSREGQTVDVTGQTVNGWTNLYANWEITPHNIYAYARLNSYFAPLTNVELYEYVKLNAATLERLGLGSYNANDFISIGKFSFKQLPLTEDMYFGDDAELDAVAAELAKSIALETGVSKETAEKIAWTVLYKTENEEDMAPGYPAEDGYQLSGNLNLATVMFEANGENVTGMPAVNYTYDEVAKIHDFYFAGDTFTMPADPTREGYIFEGWSVKVLPAENDADHLDADGADDAADETLLKAGDTYIITAGGVVFTAQWEARTDTPYTVEHYLENLDGSYALDTTEPLKGTTDTTVTAAAKSYDNFTYDSTVPGTVASGNIAGDGSLVLKLFYTRNTYDYTVRHIKQLPDGTYDEANAEVENLSGKFEALAAVTAKDYGSHYPTNDADTKQNIKIEKNLTIDVKYDLDNHTLTFETNGGSAIDPVTVRHGNAVARPADPTKDKYTFIGWYVDPEFTEEYDFATVLEADKTIYAKFELTSTPIGDIYVRYDVLHIKQLPDGSYDLANAEVEHLSAKKDTTVTAVVKDYSATHHINVNSTLSKLTDTAIQPYPGADGKPVYTILSVYYDLDFHTLTFDTMGGSRIDPVTVRHGNAVAKPKDPVNGGYIFDGWYTDKTYRTPYNFATVLTQDTTIYAKWFLIALPGVTIKKTTPKLNTSDHFAYVQGYPDGTVKPAGNITRAETAAILFRLMDEGSRKTYYSTKSGFRDVATGSWYNTYVATLNNAGVITDSSNGYFRPNEAITRAELAAMLANFTETAGAANYFNDVSARYWAANAIAICAKLGWITGYPDGSFRPDRNVTRAELMAMINRATGRAPKSADAFLPGMKTWSDNTADKWYYLDVQEATNSHSYTVKDSEKWTALNADPNWSLYE